MGNKQTKSVSSFANWQKAQTQGDIEIYQNTQNHLMAEKRSITIDPQYQLQDQLKIYHMRQNNSDALVKAFAAQEVHKKNHSEGICSGHKKLEVLTEKIPYTLVDLPQLTFPQSLLFLKESLRAYFRVFKSYGPIHVTKKLIGINDFGEVRSWINQNWALNHPNNDLPTLQSTKLDSFSARNNIDTGSEVFDAKYRDQTQMVHNIVAVIEEKCEQGKFPEAFSQEVKLHAGSFKKLSTYVEDFIRVNQLFIPPKINYDTVFVSKYQTRLAEQHQKSGQQTAFSQANQGQNGNQSIQSQRITTTTTMDNQNLGYTTNGGYQQSSNGQQSYSYGTNILQSPQIAQGGYTTSTKTATTTFGGKTISGPNSVSTYIPSYQSSSYQTYQPSIIANNISINNASNPIQWQKAQSAYKLPENQSSYTSYQYSATNPSSVGNYSYNFGGKSTSNGLEARNEQFKPSSYSSTFSNGLVGTSYSNYSGLGNLNGNTITSLENKYANENNRFAIGDNQSSASPYQNLTLLRNSQAKASPQPISTANKVSFQEFKKNFNPASSTSGLRTYEYSSTTIHGANNYEPLVSDHVRQQPTFSFDSGNKFATKFATYSDQGYSNTLKTYNQASEANPNGSELNPMLAPLLKLQQEYEAHKKSQNQRSNLQGFTNTQQSHTQQHA